MAKLSKASQCILWKGQAFLSAVLLLALPEVGTVHPPREDARRSFLLFEVARCLREAGRVCGMSQGGGEALVIMAPGGSFWRAGPVLQRRTTEPHVGSEAQVTGLKPSSTLDFWIRQMGTLWVGVSKNLWTLEEAARVYLASLRFFLDTFLLGTEGKHMGGHKASPSSPLVLLQEARAESSWAPPAGWGSLPWPRKAIVAKPSAWELPVPVHFPGRSEERTP